MPRRRACSPCRCWARLPNWSGVDRRTHNQGSAPHGLAGGSVAIPVCAPATQTPSAKSATAAMRRISTASLAQLDSWLPTVRRMRPTQPWGGSGSRQVLDGRAAASHGAAAGRRRHCRGGPARPRTAAAGRRSPDPPGRRHQSRRTRTHAAVDRSPTRIHARTHAEGRDPMAAFLGQASAGSGGAARPGWHNVHAEEPKRVASLILRDRSGGRSRSGRSPQKSPLQPE
jgi:hypothetical protein